MSRPLRVFIDGGSRGNPGPAGFGVHAEDEAGETLAELYGYLGRTTNNVAEYAALIAALDWAARRTFSELRIHSDSELLVRQWNGDYKVRNEGLKPLHARARALALRLPRVTVRHVRREQNRQADALANRAMDEQAGNVAPPV